MRGLEEILGGEENPQLAELFQQLRAAGSPKLLLDTGRGTGEYSSSVALLAALLRSLAARELARAAGKGSFFSLLPHVSSSIRLRQETLNLLNAAGDSVLSDSKKTLLATLANPSRSLTWARIQIFLKTSKELEPNSPFREFLEGRFLYLRHDRAEAEKIFRRLAQSEESGVRNLAQLDLIALLLESRRFQEARVLSSDKNNYGETGRRPLRHAMACLLLGEMDLGCDSFALLEKKIRQNPIALKEIRSFLAHHAGPFAHLMRRCKTLREQLVLVAPTVLSPNLQAALSKPLPMQRHRLRKAIEMLEESQGHADPKKLLLRILSFLESDLVVWIQVNPKAGEGVQIEAMEGSGNFLEVAKSRLEEFQKNLASKNHPSEQLFEEKRQNCHLFFNQEQRKQLLAAPHSRAQFWIPIRRGKGELLGALSVEAGYLIAPTREELFFVEELGRRLYPAKAEAATEAAEAKVAVQKGKTEPHLDSFPDYAKRRFGVAFDLRLCGRALKKIIPDVMVAATSRSPILLMGESGSGKEVFARYIHFESALREGPFIAFNCNAVPSELVESELFGHIKGAFTGAERDRVGLFEVAKEGTLLLDEIGDLKPEIQGKLLRVLQEGSFRRVGEPKEIRFEGRIVAATHRNLKEQIAKGDFREDLFHRLNRFAFSLPPLRERRDEILSVARFLLKRFAEEEGREEVDLKPEAEGWIWRQDWTGNVRALENFLYKLALFFPGEAVGEQEVIELAKKFDLTLNEKINPRGASLELIQMALESVPQFDGKPNASRAAQLLGWDRTTLRSKMVEFGITE